MDQLTRGRRRFALLVFVSIAGLMPGTADAAAPAADKKLQVLVNDTAAQLQLAYRQHPDERALRQEQLSAAVAACAAPRTEVNNDRLATWLRAAILSSMPGSAEPLPTVPSFAPIVKAEPQLEVREVPAQPQTIEKQPTTVDKQPEVVEKAIETPVPIEAVAKPDDDPFRDDPVSDSEQK